MKWTAAWLAFGLLVAVPAMAEVAAESLLGPFGPPTSTQPKPRETAKDYGTPRFWSSLDSFAMSPNSSGFDASRSSTSGLICATSSTDSRAVGQIQLPHGVDFDAMRVWGFDASVSDNMTITLQRTCLPDFGPAIPTPETLLTMPSSGSGGAFSDGVFLPSGIIADNQSCTHQIVVQFANTTGSCIGASLVFYKVRMQWFRLAPPAPALATFTDVPVGAQFFREIEALAASGVTLGCTGTEFCPDTNLTRRQMAAFLVRALGLPSNTIPDPVNP